MKKSFLLSLDFLGVSSATLCLIHCLVFPLLSFIPIGFSHNHWVDLTFASFGLYPVVKILKSSSHLFVKIILSISMSLIFYSIINTIVMHEHSILLYFGGIGMIAGHLLNYRFCRH
ncbi:MAG: MerC domain-containing protein [Flavobacteriaceae bacterium]|nr:MerC domain-containing protein [Flavobacteriaceae bacterium]